MTTHTYSKSWNMGDQANMNAWVQDFHDALDAIGLVQTADTGQWDFGSPPSYPGTNTDAGYEIWRFDDPLQSTAPIFLKFLYGRGGETCPRVRVQVGTGSNGSGTITITGMSGTLAVQNLNPANIGSFGSPTSTSRFCHVDGFLGISHMERTDNATNHYWGRFAIMRTCDNDGEPTADGCLIVWGAISAGDTNVGGYTQAVRFAAPSIAYPVQTSAPGYILGILPQNPVSTTVGSDNQVALAWTITPLARPVVGMCGCYLSEIAHGSTFQATLVGATPRTYIAIKNMHFGVSNLTGAMLWE